MADVGNGLNDGIVAVKRGAIVVSRRAENLSEEGKRQYRLISLKVKVHKELSALGARVFALVAGHRKKNPALDATVMDITAHIKRYEAEIESLEKKRQRYIKRKIKKAA